jgi:DNA repair protein RecO (recombination protein O)
MYLPTTGIVLRVTRHTDTRLIVTLYTRQAGRLSLALSDGDTAAARRRRALLMPMNIIECVTDMRPGRDIHQARDLALAIPLPRLHLNPVKSAIAQLLADILATALREPQPDALAFDYAAAAAARLDAATSGVANFHLCFLINLTTVLGIAPDLTGYRPGMMLDMAGGTLVTPATMAVANARHTLSPADTAAAVNLCRMSWPTMALYRLDRNQRNQILDNILTYYALHDIPLSQPRSLDTLRALFD